MFGNSATHRAVLLGFGLACWLLPAGPAGAVCLGIGAAQSCSDGLDRIYTGDQSTRHVIPLNKPLLASKPAEPIKPPPTDTVLTKPSEVVELKAADRALNFSTMYPGFGSNGRPLSHLCATGPCR